MILTVGQYAHTVTAKNAKIPATAYGTSKRREDDLDKFRGALKARATSLPANSLPVNPVSLSSHHRTI